MSRDNDICALVRNFEATTIEAGTFKHLQHIQVAWWYLKHYDRLEAISRFMTAITRLVEKHGAHDKYNETVTWAYLLLIQERIARRPHETFADFAEANPDLFDHRAGALHRYYRPETLKSDFARRVFVFPDRC